MTEQLTHTHTHTHTHAHQYSFHCSIPRGLAFKTSHEDHDLFLLLENYFLSTRGPYKKLGCQVSFDTLVTTKLQHSVIRYFQQRAKYFIFQQTDKFPPLMELPFQEANKESTSFLMDLVKGTFHNIQAKQHNCSSFTYCIYTDLHRNFYVSVLS